MISKQNAFKQSRVNNFLQEENRESQELMIDSLKFGKKKMSVAETNRGSVRDLMVQTFHDKNQRSLEKFKDYNKQQTTQKFDMISKFEKHE